MEMSRRWSRTLAFVDEVRSVRLETMKKKRGKIIRVLRSQGSTKCRKKWRGEKIRKVNLARELGAVHTLQSGLGEGWGGSEERQVLKNEWWLRKSHPQITPGGKTRKRGGRWGIRSRSLIQCV